MELFLAELRRSWTQFIRYRTEAISGVFITTLVFYGLFLSARYIAGPTVQLGDRLDAVIVGYVLWTLALFIMGDVAGTLQSEAQTGTLEQLFLSPFGARRVFLTRAIASLTIQILLNASILVVIMAITGRRLSTPPTLVLPFLTVLLGAYGLAFTMGGLALLLKRVQQILAILQFALLFLLSLPLETFTGPTRLWAMLLPMVPGAGLLRDLMARQQGLDWGMLAIALLNGLFYFGVGMILFWQAERETKRRGRLSGY